jgi:hypothetical protein
MWLYTFKSQFVGVTKKSGHQRSDYKVGLLNIYIGLYYYHYYYYYFISSTKYEGPVNMQTHPKFYLRYKCVYIYIYTYGLYNLITLK